MKTIHPRKQSGSSLVVVISVLATLMVVVGVAAEYTYTVNRHVQRSNTLEKAVAVGDGCLDILFSNWRTTCRTAPTTAQPTSAFSSIPLPTALQLNLPSVTNFAKRGTSIDPTSDEPADYDATYTISNYKVIAVTPEWTALSGASAAPTPELGLGQTGVINTTAANYNYIASADVTLPALGPTGKVVAKVRRVFQKQQISPWNFAIFYVDPLEIHPGAPFTVTGWVHTNSDLYTGHNFLTFADKVTYGSDWFAPTTARPTVGFMPGDLQHPQPPLPTAPNYPSNLPPAYDDAKQPFGMDANAIFNLTDPNPNNDSYRELVEPPTATPDPLSNSRYWDQSDVIIKVDNSNNVTIGIPRLTGSPPVADGGITLFTALLAPPASGGLGWGDPLRAKYQALSDMFNGAITTDSTVGIQDDREGGPVRLVTLDLKQIQNNTGGLNPRFKANDVSQANGVLPYFKGMVYIYDNSATIHSLNPNGSVNPSPSPSVRRGIRLKNGSKISAVNADGTLTGLTITSPNPVYIQGDYNTGRKYDGTVTPPSNNAVSDPLTPQVVGYNTSAGLRGLRAPCSILADAVTILSNSWLDTAAGTAPIASNTTVNTAIIAGIVPTNAYGGGTYSGGAENFPRFLETWTGLKLTYYGSMVELYKSQQSIAVWGQPSVYSPPDRQWYFDNTFKVRPPPGSIMVYSYVKGRWSLY